MSPPHGEVLLFRQKDPKPLAPVRGPSGAFAPVPKVRAAEDPPSPMNTFSVYNNTPQCLGYQTPAHDPPSRVRGCREVLLFRQKDPIHWRPGVALRVPLPQSRLFRAAELASLRQSSPPNRCSGPGRSPARRRHEVAPEADAFFFPSPSGRGQGEGEGPHWIQDTINPFPRDLHAKVTNPHNCVAFDTGIVIYIE